MTGGCAALAPWWLLCQPPPSVSTARGALLRDSSAVANRREPTAWHSELIEYTACHPQTVGSAKPGRAHSRSEAHSESTRIPSRCRPLSIPFAFTVQQPGSAVEGVACDGEQDAGQLVESLEAVQFGQRGQSLETSTAARLQGCRVGILRQWR